MFTKGGQIKKAGEKLNTNDMIKCRYIAYRGAGDIIIGRSVLKTVGIFYIYPSAYMWVPSLISYRITLTVKPLSYNFLLSIGSKGGGGELDGPCLHR